jgi:hypothetical protein
MGLPGTIGAMREIRDRDTRTRSRLRLGVLLGIAVLVLTILVWRPWSPPVPATSTERSGRAVDERPGAGADEKMHDGRDEFAGEDRILLRGYALDASTGRAVPDARVEFVSSPDRWETRTDSRGVWSLSIPPADPGFRPIGEAPGLSVEAAGYRRGGLDHLIIPRGETEWRVPTIFLREIAALVSVRVVDVNGRGVAGASVRGLGSGIVHADESGRIDVLPTSAGERWVSAEAFGYLPYERTVFIPPARPPASRSLKIVLAPAEWIEVTVIDETGQPVPGAVVREQEGGPPRARSDERGRFRWPGVDGKPRHSFLVKPGHMHPVVHSYGVADNRIFFPRVTSIEGRLLLPSGTPGSGVMVSAGIGKAEGTTALTDQDGRFRLERVSAGSLDLHASRRGLPLGQCYIKAKWPGPTTGIEFRLRGLTTARGVVVDALTGEPLAGVTIWPVVPWLAVREMLVTDDRGRFTCVVCESFCRALPLGLPGYEFTNVPLSKFPADGEVRVEMRPLRRVLLVIVDVDGNPVCGAVVVERSWAAGTASDEAGRVGVDLPLGKSTKVRVWHASIGSAVVVLKAEQEETEHRVVLGGPGSVREIRIVDEAGEPRPDAYALMAGVVHLADASGAIRIPGKLSEVNAVSAPGCERVPAPAVGPGVDSLPLTLRPAGPIRGRVVDLDGRGVAGVSIRYEARPGPLETDALGHFTIDHLAAGTARLLEARDTEQLRVTIGYTWAVAGGEDVVFVHPGFGHLRLSRGPVGEGDASVFERSQILRTGVRDPKSGWPSRRELAPVTSRPVRIRVPAGPVYLQAFDERRFRSWSVMVRVGEETAIVLPGEIPAASLTGTVTDEAGGKVASGQVTDVLCASSPPWRISGGRIITLRAHQASGVMRLRFTAPGFADHVTEPIDLDTCPDLRTRLSRGGTVIVRVRGGDPGAKDVRARILTDVGAHGPWIECPATHHHVRAGRRRVEIRHGQRLPLVREVHVHEGRTTDLDVVLPSE